MNGTKKPDRMEKPEGIEDQHSEGKKSVTMRQFWEDATEVERQEFAEQLLKLDRSRQ